MNRRRLVQTVTVLVLWPVYVVSKTFLVVRAVSMACVRQLREIWSTP